MKNEVQFIQVVSVKLWQFSIVHVEPKMVYVDSDVIITDHELYIDMFKMVIAALFYKGFTLQQAP